MTNNTANDNNAIISNNNTPTPRKPSISTIGLSSIKFESNQDYELVDIFGNLRVWTYIGWSAGPNYEIMFIFKRTAFHKSDGVIFGGIILDSYITRTQHGEYKPILDIKVSYIGESIETLHPINTPKKWVPTLITQ